LSVAGIRPAQAQPAIHLGPEAPLMDDVVQVRLAGLPAGKTVTLVATHQRGQAWRARAAFVADDQGKVDVSKQAPTSGSYSGIDPMGLFWSMEPGDDPPPKEQPPAAKVTDPRVTSFELVIDGQTVAKSELKRWLAKPGVRVTDVRDDGLVGKLFEPAEKGRQAGVLVLSGSEGGLKEADAALLASRGYVAFTLGYFNMEGLPKQLVKIPLEYLRKGIDWLKARETVDPGRIAVMGGSKGGELALLLGATFPDIKAVVASVPSHVVWSGIGGTFQDSSWTHDGKPLPCVLTRPTPAFFRQLGGKDPVVLLDLYKVGLEDEEKVRQAIIPVEKIKGAVLLISGTDDQMWPSALMADKVMARLKEHQHPYPDRHLRYEGAGHGILSAYVPLKNSVAGGRFALGGSPEANAKAIADSRPKVLQFLKENLAAR
jgi:hypothetical protein